MSDLKQKLANFKQLFDPKLEFFLDNHIGTFKSLNPAAYQNMLEVKRASMIGGKRIRPALVYYGAKIVKDDIMDIESEIFKIGISLEIFHTFALIHDDIIDESLTRRGQPTIESAYLDIFKHSYPKKYKHMATSSAILAGDLALIICENNLRNLNLEVKNLENFKKIYNQMQTELIAGQIDDCFGVGISDLSKVTEDSILRMLAGKSGNYSIQKPLALGASAAGIDEYKLEKLSQIGSNLGLVFQITDDILGLFGDPRVTGKSNTSDIIEGKRTILMKKLWESLKTTQDKDKLVEILNSGSDEQAYWVKQALIENGIKDEAINSCQLLINQSEEILDSVFQESESTEFIKLLGRYLLTRDK